MYFDIYKLHSVIGGKQLWSETYGAACVTFFKLVEHLKKSDFSLVNVARRKLLGKNSERKK